MTRIERFLRRWERTKGYGLKWGLKSGRYLRARFEGHTMCPVSAVRGFGDEDYDSLESLHAAGLTDVQANQVAGAADNKVGHDPEIRRRLLAGVGLEQERGA